MRFVAQESNGLSRERTKKKKKKERPASKQNEEKKLSRKKMADANGAGAGPSSTAAAAAGTAIVPAAPAAPPALVGSMHGIVPTLQNIVATVNLDCKLDLKSIALHARNAEYNPKVSFFCVCERNASLFFGFFSCSFVPLLTSSEASANCTAPRAQEKEENLDEEREKTRDETRALPLSLSTTAFCLPPLAHVPVLLLSFF